MVGSIGRGVRGETMLPAWHFTPAQIVPDMQNRILGQHTEKECILGSYNGASPCVPGGSVFIHNDDAVVMSAGHRVTKASALLGYVLAEHVDSENSDPTRTDCVDIYVMDALKKHDAYTSKALRSQQAPNRTNLSPPRPSRTNRRIAE